MGGSAIQRINSYALNANSRSDRSTSKFVGQVFPVLFNHERYNRRDPTPRLSIARGVAVQRTTETQLLLIAIDNFEILVTLLQR